MIEVQQLTKWYGPVQALDRVNLSVPKGRIVGFLGPNGAGKTTAIRILTCFMPATSGSATINGANVFTESQQVRQSLGYLPENTPLYPEMRVVEHLHYFGKLHGLTRMRRRQRIDELTFQCGLQQILRRPIGQLSKGNRQRVGLAQALLHDPPVLILDEPTAGLDPGQVGAVRSLIRDLAGEKTILLSTHILPEVEKTCEEVVIIARGRIVAEGTPAQLKARVRSQGAVLLEVAADAAAVKTAIESLEAVSQVHTEAAEGWTTARVAPKPAAGDIRPELGRLIVAKQWTIRSMRFEVGTLEEYFVQVTDPETHAAA